MRQGRRRGSTGVGEGELDWWEKENLIGGIRGSIKGCEWGEKPKSSMASTSRRQRRERRFRRYLSAGRLVRAQALLQRHPGLDVDAGQPPPLHRACARHDAPALCLLLRLGADPAHQDRHGDTALHAAARQGPDAYTDFFLPLLSRCPSAMGIKNKDGETPGQILGWGPPWDSAEEEEEDDASKEREWRQKLQGDASHETQEPESFSAWSDRLAREHAQKCQQQQREAEGSCRPPRAEGSSQSWRQQEEEQRLFRERARVKEEELRESRARRAQEALGDREPKPARAGPRAEHPRGAGRGSLWRFGDVPWPCPGGGDPEAMAAALVARGPPLEEQGALRRYLRVQQVRWHPDRFLQRFRSQIETWELGRVMGAVTALSQALNRHAEALK
ncbi:NF-kappa-B inhibitor-like protein 1 isoform X2 [Macaca nemestrina]|uniref:NF-kappa-B inhibitor-like protein 1 isoform X2 n=1 Tax=Macaca nemestrina TaxID=9545 RepID=UPI0005F558CB|nr:NF-kappa-B inhibitor-like protein 1 isoform X2 [Macaca nemestrina]XP_011855844.1 PREDICTED: NF-kappa-B inhibitor-like protein 1 isoform X2 [Mandrillus leucophaeus]XP_050644400.1 NF-kappa-B inhibitor-like protein 1 isoform X2 [Macaca thibetana thibetana]